MARAAAAMTLREADRRPSPSVSGHGMRRRAFLRRRELYVDTGPWASSVQNFANCDREPTLALLPLRPSGTPNATLL